MSNRGVPNRQKSQNPDKPPSGKNGHPKNGRPGGWYLATDAVVRIAEHFGLAGVALVIGWQFVERHAAEEQKQEIINIYVLGKGITSTFPVLIVVVLAILVWSAQHVFWKKRMKVLEDEIKRLADWKSTHQEKQIGTGLHHSTGT